MSNDKATPRPHVPEDCAVEQCPLCAPIFADREHARTLSAGTPTPWQYAVDGRGYSIRTVTKGIGERIATGILRLPDAALIVEAVNAYDGGAALASVSETVRETIAAYQDLTKEHTALKAQNAELAEALRECVKYLDAPMRLASIGTATANKARAALAKAGGK